MQIMQIMQTLLAPSVEAVPSGTRDGSGGQTSSGRLPALFVWTADPSLVPGRRPGRRTRPPARGDRDRHLSLERRVTGASACMGCMFCMVPIRHELQILRTSTTSPAD